MHEAVLYTGTTHTKGSTAEDYVAQMLTYDNFSVIARNFRSRWGEIDIIAQKDDLIACVEVKSRQKPSVYLDAVITPTKQHKIIATAKYFISLYNKNDLTCRFDVAFVTTTPDYRFSVHYIAHAFTDCNE